jgi:hypothetical protein
MILPIATLLCVLANAVEVAAKVLRARFVTENITKVGLATRWIPYLAAIEGAGVAGLVAGLLGARPLGLAAAAGLVAFFVVAVLVHVRARVFHNIAFPVIFLALAAAATAHFAGTTT